MKKNLLKSTFVVSFMTATSRVTGFLRDLVCASYFGTSPGMDAFLVAYRIPNFLRNLFAEGAFSQAFVPVLSEYRQKRTPEEVQIFVDRMAGTMALFLFVITILAVIIAPILIWVLAPGYIHDPMRYSLTTSMLRITFPYLLFISLTALASGILNSYSRFSAPAFAPNILNLSLIGAAIWLAPHFQEPAKALAWGVFIGGLAQLLFQLPFLKHIKLLPRPKICWNDSGVKRVLTLMVPAVFGASVAQISFFVDISLASFLKQGSISWLYYSNRLTLFPLGVFGVAIATVVLPYLARKHATKSTEEFSQALDWGLRFVLVIGVPAMLGMLMLAAPLLITLFNHGKFTHFDVTMAQQSLMAFSLGTPAFMLVKILSSGFYAKQDIKTPVRIAVIAMIANIFLAVALIWPLKHAGLALATSLTSSLNAVLLLITLLRTKTYQPCAGWLKFFLQLTFASLILMAILWFGNSKIDTWYAWSNLNRAIHLGLLLGTAILCYFGSLMATGIRLKQFLLHEEG